MQRYAQNTFTFDRQPRPGDRESRYALRRGRFTSRPRKEAKPLV